MLSSFCFLHKDKDVVKNSSSGGAFTILSDVVLSDKGIIYGCILDENKKAIHVRCDNKAERNKMRGSKYIQSDMLSCYSLICDDLKNDKIVMFSGTPCQISAIKNFLAMKKISTDKLILLEVICHGVGSDRFFQDYINHLEKKYKGKALKVNFRAKHKKGKKQDMEIVFENGKVYNASSTKYDWFYSVYLKNLILRPACYECPYASPERIADITIADHWGYKDNDSYSLVLCNTEKGELILRKAGKENFVEVKKEDIHQPHMSHPCKKPLTHGEFWDIYLSKGYLAVQTWIGNNTIKGKTFDILARIIYSLGIAGIIKKIKRSICKFKGE